MNSTDVWQFLADSIVKLAIGEIDAKLQWFCSSGLTTPCSLIDSNSALNTDVVYQLGNSIPALSNAYIPFSDLFSSYQLFLNMLTPAALGMRGSGSTGITPDIKNLQQTLLKELSGISKHPLSFAKNPMPFMKKRGEVIKSIRQQEQSLSLAFKANNQQQYANIIAAARNKMWQAGTMLESNGYNMKSSSTPSLYYPRFEMPSFVEQYKDWQTVTTKPIVFEINQSALSKMKCSSVSHCQAMAIKQNLSPSIRTTDPIVAQSSVIEVTFERLKSFNINPGLWFNVSLIRLHRLAQPHGLPMFFSNSGSLSLLPTKIVLGFRPAVRYRMTRESYQVNKTELQKHISSNDYKFSDVESTIEYGPTNTSLPSLVGVLATRL